MSFIVTRSQSHPDMAYVGLMVSAKDPTTVAVRAGSFKFLGVDYTFPEEHLWGMPVAPPVDVYVTGYIAKDTRTEAPLLIIDDLFMDGEDIPFRFEGTSYKVLHELFRFKIPAGTATLNLIDVDVRHIGERI